MRTNLLRTAILLLVMSPSCWAQNQAQWAAIYGLADVPLDRLGSARVTVPEDLSERPCLHPDAVNMQLALLDKQDIPQAATLLGLPDGQQGEDMMSAI